MTRGDVAALGAFFYKQDHRKSSTVVGAHAAAAMLGACLFFGSCQTFLLSDDATFADAREADGGAPDAGPDTAGCQGCAETERCDELTHQCVPACEADSCLFAGNCFPEGAKQPGNPCLVCERRPDRHRWSSITSDTDCDGNFCTVDDHCDNGNCVGGRSRDCPSDDLTCTEELCNRATARCETTVTEDNCAIGGTCVGDSQINPDQICQACNPSKDPGAYSVRSDSPPCDDGLTCTKNDACRGGVCVGKPEDLGSRCPAGYCDDGGRCGGDLVAAGASHSCVLRDGKLFCFGQNHHGQLGNAPMLAQLSPVRVGADSDWSQVVAGDSHTCGRRGGAIYCWGKDEDGQLGNGEDTNGWFSTPQRVGTGEDWGALAAGGDHTCAIRQGALYCWGRNTQGQLGDGTDVNRHAPTRVGPDMDWIAVTAGMQHTCGLRGSDLYCWGYNAQKQLGDGSTGNSRQPVRIGEPGVWSSICAGDSHTCGLQSGTLFCWGSNGYRQLGPPINTSEASVPTKVYDVLETIACGGGHTCTTRQGGELVCWGQLTDGMMANHGWQPMWTGVSSGRSHICGVQEGKFRCWGENDSGQLGDGTKIDRAEPADVTLGP